jgi:hypothetical protein
MYQYSIVQKLLELGSKYFDNPDGFADCALLVFYMESGLNPYAHAGKAYGLYQMLDTTAKGLGIDFNLFKASGWEQVNYYQKLIDWQFKIKVPENFLELYLLNFYPAYINEPLNKVFPKNVCKDNNLPENCTIAQWYEIVQNRIHNLGYSNILNLTLKKKELEIKEITIIEE